MGDSSSEIEEIVDMLEEEVVGDCSNISRAAGKPEIQGDKFWKMFTAYMLNSNQKTRAVQKHYMSDTNVC